MPLCSRIEVIIGWFLPPRSHRLSSTSPFSLNLITHPVLRLGYIHAAAEARHAQREIERRRAHADDRQPVIAVGGAIDVVRIARHVVDDDIESALVRTGIPIAADPRSEEHT